MKTLSPRQMKLAQQVKRDIDILESKGFTVTERQKAYLRDR